MTTFLDYPEGDGLDDCTLFDLKEELLARTEERIEGALADRIDDLTELVERLTDQVERLERREGRCDS